MNRSIALLALAVWIAACTSVPPPDAQSSTTASPPPELMEGGPVLLGPDEALRMDAEAYARRYNVTVEQAVERLQFQDGIGELNAALQADEGDTFGGLWIEHEPDYRIVALFTRKGEGTIRPYLEGKPFAGMVEVRKVRYTLAELETIYAGTTRELAKLDFSVNVSLDVTGNRIEIMVSDRKWFEGELKRVGAKLPKGVELVVVAGASTARDKELLLTPPVPGIAFPRQKPSEGSSPCMEALLIGTLRLEGGCLYVQPLAEKNSLLPIWQPGYTLRLEGDQVLVVNGQGEEAARVGEEVWMGGGMADPGEWVLQQIPSACLGRYFIACGGVRPNLKQDSELFALDVITDTERTVLFLRYKPALDQQVLEPALISGRLVAYDYGRCLHLETDRGSMNLLWPTDWSARFEAETVVVLDEAGQVVARMGEEVYLRGRSIPHSADVPPYSQLMNELPGDCVGASWLVDGEK